MLALVLLLLAVGVMWTAQSVLLRGAGMPIRLRIDSSGLPRHLQSIDRLVMNGSLVSALMLYPVLRGQSPWTYYLKFLPPGRPAIEWLHGFTMAVIFLGVLYAGWAITDVVRFRVRQHPGRVARRLLAVPATAVFGAGLEELLFRGMLLAGLLDSLPPGIAAALAALVFAAAHYVRKVKRYWTFAGHVALGTMLCTAFVCTRTLWLPMGLHAGGIVIIMGVRPFVRSNGPGWLVGSSIFPYAGVIGVVGLTLLTINIWHFYGGAP